MLSTVNVDVAMPVCGLLSSKRHSGLIVTLGADIAMPCTIDKLAMMHFRYYGTVNGVIVVEG